MPTEADHIHALQLVRCGSGWAARCWYRIGPGRYAPTDFGVFPSPQAAEDGFFRTIELMDRGPQEENDGDC